MGFFLQVAIQIVYDKIIYNKTIYLPYLCKIIHMHMGRI